MKSSIVEQHFTSNSFDGTRGVLNYLWRTTDCTIHKFRVNWPLSSCHTVLCLCLNAIQSVLLHFTALLASPHPTPNKSLSSCLKYWKDFLKLSIREKETTFSHPPEISAHTRTSHLAHWRQSILAFESDFFFADTQLAFPKQLPELLVPVACRQLNWLGFTTRTDRVDFGWFTLAWD